MRHRLIRVLFAALLVLLGMPIVAPFHVRAEGVTEFSAAITAGSSPTYIAAGPDGNLWFTESQGNRVGRITPQGTVTEFSADITAGSFPYGIAAGADGNLWFTEANGHRVGRITPQGAVTEF